AWTPRRGVPTSQPKNSVLHPFSGPFGQPRPIIFKLLSLPIPAYCYTMNKEQVAQILSETATLLDLKGENPFKSRAYANAARAIETLNQPLEKVFAPGSEAQIKGIGDSLHEKICELLATGKLAYHEELKSSLPAGLLE